MDKITEEILEGLEATQKDFWNVARETANFLNMLVKIAKCKNGIEVGTSNGYSGIWLGKAFQENGGKLTTIEYWDKRQSIARNHFKTCGIDDVIEAKLGCACEILGAWEEKLDFAFIDANKTQYLEYFELVDKHLVKGGIITADNITSHPEKVENFITALKNHPKYQTEILDLPGGLLIAYKIAD